jgi:hypothetical protein
MSPIRLARGSLGQANGWQRVAPAVAVGGVNFLFPWASSVTMVPAFEPTKKKGLEVWLVVCLQPQTPRWALARGNRAMGAAAPPASMGELVIARSRTANGLGKEGGKLGTSGWFRNGVRPPTRNNGQEEYRMPSSRGGEKQRAQISRMVEERRGLCTARKQNRTTRCLLNTLP